MEKASFIYQNIHSKFMILGVNFSINID